jgi:hypothetical protein
VNLTEVANKTSYGIFDVHSIDSGVTLSIYVLLTSFLSSCRSIM